MTTNVRELVIHALIDAGYNPATAPNIVEIVITAYRQESGDEAARATAAAFKTWPDETEPFEFEGHQLNRITVDRGSLRYAFAQGAAWQRGEAWAQPKTAPASIHPQGEEHD